VRERNGAQPLLVDGQVVGYLQEARPPNAWLRTTPEGAFLNRVNAAAALSAGVAVLIALAVGGFLAFTLTRSLRELQDATEALAEGDLGRQVPVRSQDELGQLGLAFNRMSADLARATQARRQMTADIAHDLRTPLAVLAGYAEALSDGKLAGSDEIFAVLEQETRYLRRLVDDLGLLSLADAGELALLRAPVDPAALVQGAARRYAVAAGERDVTLTAETAGVGAARLDADAERLAQVLDNLVGNALRYTPEGGDIVIGATEEQETVRLWVQDSGPGIAAADLPYIFDRAYRGDAARHGGAAGLGLAIARSLVRAHGGEISVRSAPGEGALFEIVLPQAGTRKQSD
jgi:signal transduction histidine kinase